MQIFAAGEAKNSFGKVLDTVQKESVVIEKKGRAVAVMLSIDEYQRLQNLEDNYWGEKAYQAKQEGYIGNKESSELLMELLNEKS